MGDRRQLHFHGALDGLVREEELFGRPHLVAPVTMVKEMVLPVGNGQGELLPAEEIQLSAEMDLWDGRPVTIGHPMKNGRWLSAGSLEAAEEFEVGSLRNVTAKANGEIKLQGEAWIDREKAERLEQGEAIVELLEQFTAADVPAGARPLEVSTGYWASLEETAGKHNGEQFRGKQRNVLPDHLAVLPDSVGKCSLEDGCGMPRLNAHGLAILSSEVDLRHVHLTPDPGDEPRVVRTNVLSSARTPDFDGTEPGEVPEGWPPSLSDFIEANGWDAEDWSDLTEDQQGEVVATTLLGEPADSFEASMVFPVVDTGGNLRENALEAVLGGRGAQADVPEDALESARGVARTLLEDEFDRDLEDEDEEGEQNAAQEAPNLNLRDIGRRVLEAVGIVDPEDLEAGDGDADHERNQDLSLDDRRDLVNDEIEARFGGPNVFTWIVEFFEDRVIYAVDPEGEAETIWSSPYTIDEETEDVTLGERTEVEKQVEFVPVENGQELELEVNYTPRDSGEEIEMDREALIDRLANCDDCPFQRETLEAMGEEELVHAANTSDVDFEADADGDGGDPDDADAGTSDSDAEPQANADADADGDGTVALEDLPPEVRAVVDAHRNEAEQERETLVTRIQEHAEFTEDQLDEFGLPTLRQLAESVTPPEKRSYASRGGPRSRDTGDRSGDSYFDKNPTTPAIVTRTNEDGE